MSGTRRDTNSCVDRRSSHDRGDRNLRNRVEPAPRPLPGLRSVRWQVRAAVAQQQSRRTFLFGIAMGTAIGGISALVGIVAPNIERWADSLPARRLGIFGTT